MRDLRLLPKAHLHVHLEPTMRPSTLDELGLSVPPVGRFTDLPTFMVERARAGVVAWRGAGG